MKNLLNLKGAKALNKKEQQSINGGREICCEWCPIPGGGVYCLDYSNGGSCAFAPVCP